MLASLGQEPKILVWLNKLGRETEKGKRGERDREGAKGSERHDSASFSNFSKLRRCLTLPALTMPLLASALKNML